VKWLFVLLPAIVAIGLGLVLLVRHDDPYNGPAVHAPLCGGNGLAESPCRSPDGRWTVELGQSGLVLTRTATARKTVMLGQGCCGEIAWARPHRLVFTGDDGYSAYMLDPATQNMFSMGFSNIYVSPDGRWVLGDRDESSLGHAGPYLGGLVSVAKARCFAIPGDVSIGQTDSPFKKTGFTPDGSAVVIERSGDTWRYPISSLRQPCGADLLGQ
jgi:hypothetical protein